MTRSLCQEVTKNWHSIPSNRTTACSGSNVSVDLGIVSLTLGNSTLPLGDGLVADRKLLRQLPLGQSLTLSLGGDESSDFELIHSLPPFLFTFSLTKKRPHFHPRRIEKPSTFRRGPFFCSVLRLARPSYSSNSPGNRWVKTLFRKPGAAR